MDDTKLEYFHGLLLEQQEELMNIQKNTSEDVRPVSLDQSSVGRLSRMDAMQSQAMAVENQRRRKLQLTRIEAALERLENGDYGYCASCDEEINQRRLEIDPSNPFCVHCASGH